MEEENVTKYADVKDRLFILEGHTPIREPDIFKWAEWFNHCDRLIALDILPDVRISTIFLGVDFDLDDNGPILFETMISGGSRDHEKTRYRTWRQALDGHRRIVYEIFAAAVTEEI